MLFTEPLFFAFFAIVFLAYWSLRDRNARKWLLLIASYFFYAAWDWRFCGLIFASTMIDFIVGLRLRDSADDRRRFWVTVSVVTNLGLLGFFKYFNFFIESANSIFGHFELGGIRTLDIILPVGISFYTFQTMSYTIDVYRRRMEPISDFRDFALFVSFFPQLVMGPILRGASFIPQLDEEKRFDAVPVRPLLTLFLFGFVKKACISDNIAPLVDSFYSSPAAYDAASTWIVVGFYAIQLYCDFSGYTDMAIAVSGLLGYRVDLNFDFPFFARNITDFWRRWHISFSSWLRDYLYIPLGGSRVSEGRIYSNLMLTMLLSGLWHGAGWTFITWGALNGLGLAVHRFYQKNDRVRSPLDRLFSVIGWPLTFFWFAFTLIYFRAPTFGEAWAVTGGLVAKHASADLAINPAYALWFVPLLVAHWISWRSQITARTEFIPGPIFALGYGILWAMAMAFVRLEYRPFIYFQF